ncbi:unnamed protein product [Effrenium voratum]|uniref:F-actin-capping protein subunit beta n=1 Tax=Effrenium voratum TaxID=2562239 RepID=A0AA36JAC0_9DINO|nr:unnamed protein product [Effrenium voratum]CAJ1449469.1 unnamed protein product [Effrenium voratum]
MALSGLKNLVNSAVSEERQKSQGHTAAALGLLQRLPPKDLEADLDALVAIAPDLEPSLAPYVTRPLKVKEDLKANRYFIVSEYNCDGGSHRSPWTDRYIPAPPGGDAEEERFFRPPERLKRLEETFNEVFEAYATSYYEGCVSSVYLWDLEEGYAGAFLIRKELSKVLGDGKTGVWDSVHVLEVREAPNSHQVDFKLSSSVLLHAQVSPKAEQTELSAHLTRQTDSKLDRRKKSGEDAHIVHIGMMIEDNENFLRHSLGCIHLAKQQTVLDSLRSVEGAQASEAQREKKHRLLPQLLSFDSQGVPQRVAKNEAKLERYEGFLMFLDLLIRRHQAGNKIIKAWMPSE